MKKILFAVIAAAFALTTFAACTPQEADPMTYTNETYGYSLTFPESWTGFVVTESDSTVYFGIPGDEELFVVSAYTVEQWEDLQTADGPKPSTKLGENTEYIFAYEVGNGGPKAGSEAAFDEIEAVVGTFAVK
jgi:hypothetical protein